MMHYRTLLKFEPNNTGALNNIAILYGEGDMPINGVGSYKKAIQNGNALAAANLAYQYMDAGFADEARKRRVFLRN